MSREMVKGIKLYRRFNEKRPDAIDKITLPEYDVLVEIGPCTHIAYLAADGENYIHKFAKKSQPKLCVSSDGLQLYLLKGKYQFTDRGIIDK